MIEWINVFDKLPKDKKFCLGYCQIRNNSFSDDWFGILQVSFDAQSGWRRFDYFDSRDVKVLYWANLPELPTIGKNDIHNDKDIDIFSNPPT